MSQEKKKKNLCSACGTSPVNHSVLFFYNLINETFGKLGSIFLNFNKSKTIANYAEIVIQKFLSAIGFVRFSDDIEKATSGRSKLIWEEAQRRGIKMQQLVIWGKYIENYRAKINGKLFYFESIPIPPWLPQSGYAWVDDKFKLSKKLSKANINTPKTKKIYTASSARKNFHFLTKPVIVKPQNGSRGRHTTTNINTPEEAVKAFYLAYKISPSMVIQEHLFGSVYRATVIDNKLVGFFRADPPTVTGDGIHSIAELIQNKNNHKNEKLADILINEELSLNTIQHDKYKWFTIEELLNHSEVYSYVKDYFKKEKGIKND